MMVYLTEIGLVLGMVGTILWSAALAQGEQEETE